MGGSIRVVPDWSERLAMKYAKVSVTLEQEVLAELRRATGRRGLSAFVNEAVRQRLQAVRLKGLLDELEQEHGPIPEDVRKEVAGIEWPD